MRVVNYLQYTYHGNYKGTQRTFLEKTYRRFSNIVLEMKTSKNQRRNIEDEQYLAIDIVPKKFFLLRELQRSV